MKACTGQIYLQKTLSSNRGDNSVGSKRSNRIASPEILGEATMVVEKVARIRKITSRSQLLLKAAGQDRESPKNLLLNPFVRPFFGVKIEPLWIRSPKMGKGQIVHQIRPPSGVMTAMIRNSHTAHIRSTPRFRPDIFVPKKEVMITI